MLQTTTNSKLILAITAFITFACHSSIAQLVTSTVQTPQQLVQNVLLGSGVTVSNITYTGHPDAIGEFDGSNCNIGFNAGLVLTTGTVLDTSPSGIQNGPFGPNDSPSSGVDNLEPGEPLLTAASGNPSFNATRLEFDFISPSDSVEFNYIFASEEYLEYVNQSYNDAFGFFLSGPNPAGGNFVDQNIALVPGTNLPVTIDNINDISYPAYYVDNGDGTVAPQNASNTYVQYDGFTTELTAKSAIVCNQTYHLVIVIADIGDGIYDSGVFIQAESFSSPGIQIGSDLSFQGNVANDSTLIEGCSDAEMWFIRTDSLAFNQTIPLVISGTATNGSDYNNIPNSIFFPAGEDSASIQINAIQDNLTEPLEFVQILVNMPSACGTPITDSIKLYIQNADPLLLDLPDTISSCETPITLNAAITGGTPGFSYLWNNGSTTSSITVSPSITTNYSVIVTDTCGQFIEDTMTLTIDPFIPISIEVSNDTLINCYNAPVDLSATIIGGGTLPTISWSNGDSGSNITVTVTNTQTYYATVTDNCGNTHIDSVTITLEEIPILVEPIDTIICAGETVELIATPTGGVGQDYDFIWGSGQTDSIINVNPTSTSVYTVGISDACGITSAWGTFTINVSSIIADFEIDGTLEEGSLIQFNNTSAQATNYFWDLGNGETSYEVNPWSFYNEPQNYVITLHATNELGCIDSTIRVIQIKPDFFFNAPNAFTPDNDEYNQTWKPIVVGVDIYDFTVLIFNRWGELIWENHDPSVGWDGTYNGRISQTGVYVWTAKIKLPGIDDRRTYNGTVNLIK